ncbi:MAG: hypothetical protein U0575_04360 [Phycisphaerales bacterium]
MTADPRVVACTAAMPDGTGISKVQPRLLIERGTPHLRATRWT